MAIAPKKVKRTARERRKLRQRKTITGSQDRPRLSVFKSNTHTYAQIISDVDGKTLASASTLDAEVKKIMGTLSSEGMHNESKSSKSSLAAKAVGLVIAQRGKEKKVAQVVFDRNGFVYHGRVRAVAEGAREGGLDF